MFMISIVHLGLVVQEAWVPPANLSQGNFQAQIVLATLQVGHWYASYAPLESNHIQPVCYWRYGSDMEVNVSFCFVLGWEFIITCRVWVIWGRNYLIAAGPLAIMIVAAGLSFMYITFLLLAKHISVNRLDVQPCDWYRKSVILYCRARRPYRGKHFYLHIPIRWEDLVTESIALRASHQKLTLRSSGICIARSERSIWISRTLPVVLVITWLRCLS